MRTSILMLVVVIPVLGACSAAWAKTTADIDKPVCTHYDDTTKPTVRTSADVATQSPTATAATNAAAPSSGNSPAPQAKTGSSGLVRSHSAPRWLTLLPGMFR